MAVSWKGSRQMKITWKQRFYALIAGNSDVEFPKGGTDGNWVIRIPRKNGNNILDDVDRLIAQQHEPKGGE
mgnify:CR=1 FL=1